MRDKAQVEPEMSGTVLTPSSMMRFSKATPCSVSRMATMRSVFSTSGSVVVSWLPTAQVSSWGGRQCVLSRIGQLGERNLKKRAILGALTAHAERKTPAPDSPMETRLSRPRKEGFSAAIVEVVRGTR